MCQSTILSANGQTTITYCNQCKTHYIWQKSFLLTFNAYQYRSFIEGIMEKKGKEEFFEFPDGIERIMLHTPLAELTFTFTYLEWNNFVLSLEESSYMLEVYQLIG